MENNTNENTNEQTHIPVSAQSRMSRLFLPVAILIVGALISASIIYTRGYAPKTDTTQKEAPKVEVSADDDPYLGDLSAPVKIIEFSDFQCPFCRTFWKDTLPSIRKDYVDTGKVMFVYRDFPLSFHPAALPAALASNCAKDQNKYWEMHDKMFSEQDKLGQGTITFGVKEIKRWAKDIGLKTVEFNQCLDSEKYKAEVEKDIADGSKAGVSGTPTSYINGVALVGAQPYSVFKTTIDKALEETKTKKKGFFR